MNAIGLLLGSSVYDKFCFHGSEYNVAIIYLYVYHIVHEAIRVGVIMSYVI